MLKGRKRITWQWYLVMSLAVLGGLVATFLPEISAGIWHWRHGNSVAFEGWSFPVPEGWDVLLQKDGISILRIPRTFRNEIERTISIGKLHWDSVQPFDEEKFRKRIILLESGEGYEFRQDEIVHLGAESIHCYRFLGLHGPNSAFMTCNLPSERLWFEFEGASQDLPEVYTVLQGMRPASQR